MDQESYLGGVNKVSTEFCQPRFCTRTIPTFTSKLSLTLTPC